MHEQELLLVELAAIGQKKGFKDSQGKCLFKEPRSDKIITRLTVSLGHFGDVLPRVEERSAGLDFLFVTVSMRRISSNSLMSLRN